MPRFYVFPDEASARACVDGIDARARRVYVARSFTQDLETGGIVSKDVNGEDIPGAVTTTFAVPWRRTDGKWVVRHCEAAPYAAVILDASRSPPLTVEGLVAAGVPADAPVESFDPSWLPLSPVLPGAIS